MPTKSQLMTAGLTIGLLIVINKVGPLKPIKDLYMA